MNQSDCVSKTQKTRNQNKGIHESYGIVRTYCIHILLMMPPVHPLYLLIQVLVLPGLYELREPMDVSVEQTVVIVEKGLSERVHSQKMLISLIILGRLGDTTTDTVLLHPYHC